jgi:hypothetical protein
MVINYERRPEMNGTKKHFGFLVVGLGVGLVAGCAASVFPNEETPGQRFDRAMKQLAANCAKAKLKPNDTACDILKLKPADPLATEEGRFAHSLKIPNPVPEDSGYRPGMTPQEYFEHLCKTEAGEFIYKTVENVEGLYMMRPRKEATDDELSHLYALEDPYGDTDDPNPQDYFIQPPYGVYEFAEEPVRTMAQDPSRRYRRYYRGSEKDSKKDFVYMKERHSERVPYVVQAEDAERLRSHYGYTWRGISRPHDRELGIAGGELIVLDVRTNEVLAVRRGFIRSGGVRNLTGIWWLNGQICPKKNPLSTSQFIQNVLKPRAAAK